MQTTVIYMHLYILMYFGALSICTTESYMKVCTVEHSQHQQYTVDTTELNSLQMNILIMTMASSVIVLHNSGS